MAREDTDAARTTILRAVAPVIASVTDPVDRDALVTRASVLLRRSPRQVLLAMGVQA